MGIDTGIGVFLDVLALRTSSRHHSPMDHVQFMHRCLELATLGRRHVGNGAMVGAVLVRDGKIIAEGFHEGFGKGHAERMLLQNFDQEIQQNDVLYVNLEPCCHTGKTPPCTDIILKRGVKHVVYGLGDPDPLVAGKGIEILRQQGVTVTGPFLRTQCERLNRGFLSLRRNNRPYITLKMSKTKDGLISNPDKSPLKITSQEQDIWSHTFLRNEADAILVGVSTIVFDNPKLNTRLAQKNTTNFNGALNMNSKLLNKKIDHVETFRVILDPHFRIPVNAQVVTDEILHRTIILINKDAEDRKKVEELRRRGVKVMEVPADDQGFVWSEIWKTLTTPAGDFYGIGSILVEGGERTWEMFREAGVVDEEVTLIGERYYQVVPAGL